MDLHTLLMLVGYSGTVAVFIWKMGAFTGRLETILMGMKDEIAELKDTVIVKLQERVSNLEKKKR